MMQGSKGASPTGAAADALFVVDKSDAVAVPGHISNQLPVNCVVLPGRPEMRELTSDHGFGMSSHLKQPHA